MENQLLYSTLINESGEILNCNELLRKKLGFESSSALIGKNIFEVFKAWEIDKLAHAINSCKVNPELTVTITVNYRASYDTRHVYQWTITGEKNEKGKSIIHLIGKGAEAEENLLFKDVFQNQALFEQFMKHSPIVGWVTDEEGIMQYMNPTYLLTYGLTKRDLGKDIFQLFPKEIAADYQKNNLTVLKENKAIETIEKGISGLGRQQVLKIFKFPLLVHGKKMVAGWAIDISNQVALQEEFNKNAERYHFVNKATSDAIYDWDIQKQIIYRGEGFQTLFGYDNWNSSFRTGLHYIHPCDIERVKNSVFTALRNETNDRWQIEYRFKDAWGNYKHVADKAFIIREEGKVIRVIGAMQDLTEQKILQQRLLNHEKESRKQIVRSIIETQEKERKELSVELHDNVNQILSSCKLMLEVARTNHDSAPVLIDKAYTNMQTVISEIRRISHQLNPSAVQDLGLVDAVGQMISDLNASGTINIKFIHSGISNKDCLKDEDRIAVFRIIQEKLANILKHSQAKNALIKLSFNKNVLTLVMSDDGIGFDLSRAKKGIGLKNIQNRVEYYQGTMRFETAPGNGCRMEITMHLHDQ